MDERRYRGVWSEECSRRAEQEARLREAEWPEWSSPRQAASDDDTSGWSYQRTIRRPRRSLDDSWAGDDSAACADERSRTPTRPIARPWLRRAHQIAIHHEPICDAEPTVPSLPVVAPRVAYSPRRLARAKRRMPPARWLVRHWQGGTLSRALLVAGVTALLFACCVPGVFIARSAYAASDGYHHLMHIEALITQQGAAALVNPANEAYLREELAAAHDDFVTLEATLGAGQIIVQTNSGLQNVARLAALAEHLTSGGLALLDVAHATLGPLLSNPFAAQTTGALSQNALAAAHAQLAAAQAQMDDAAAIAPTITSDGLPGSFAGGRLRALLGKVGDAARLTRYFALLLDAAPALLGVGTPATYLLLAMDRSELRTGGGFIGNYGILTIDRAHLQTAQLQDTYVLDAAYYARTGQQPPTTYPWWPYRYGSAIYGWGLRDSNLSPDFPTNARAALRILNAVQGDPQLRDPYPVRGVIAITSVVMGQIIAITGGSLRLPEYPDHVITPANLDDTIHCFQLGACRDETPFTRPGMAQSADRKHFTAILGQALVDRVRHLPGSQLKAFMKQVFQDLSTKDIQLYFTDARAESVLQDARLGGGIAPGSGDTFFVTDTNIGGNKANAYVTQREADLVTLLPDGSALHRLLVRTIYQRRGPLYEGSTGQTSYWEYRRIYFPAHARYLGSAGVAGGSGRHKLNAATASDTAGYAMTGAALSIDDGSQLNQCQPLPGAPATQLWNCAPQVRDEFFYWITPRAWQKGPDGKIHYTLLVQRQAGSMVMLSVRLDARAIAGRMPLLADIVQDYDIPSAASPNGYAGQTTAAWTALNAGAKLLYDGPLNQDVTLTWVG